MARKVHIKASAEDVAKGLEDQGEFAVPPAGYYVMKVVEANPGFSKTDGEEDKTKPYIELVLEFVGKGKEAAPLDGNYGRVWDYVTFSKEAGWKRANFMSAFFPDSVVPGQEIDMDIDLDELIERQVFCRIKHEKDKLKSEEEKKTVMRARIARMLSMESDEFSAAETAGADAYAAAEDVPESNPFEEGAEGDALLTEEELGEMDIKELGAVAKEFDLDPNDFIVKVKGKVDLDKTKAAVIEAVLAAQGGEGTEEGGDESPF